MSLFYVAALVLNPIFCIRYINLYQPRKWRALALAKVKKLWERYREAKILAPTIIPFLYKKQNKGEATKPLNTYNCIKASLETITKLANKDEYKDYNLQELYDLSIKGALAQ